MPIQTSLVSEFRRRVQDVRPSRRAFGFSLAASANNSATIEIRNGRFIVSALSGVPSCDLALSDTRFNTVGGLVSHLKKSPGYIVNVDEDANHDHPTIDIAPLGPAPVSNDGTGVEVYHHLFADFELEEILTQAIQRHNPTMTIETLPPQEQVFVLTLAHSEVCKRQAYDASKRKGLDYSVGDLLAIATSLETQYETDVERLKRAIQSPREANPNIMDEGDAVLGRLNRRSLRTGFQAPISASVRPDPPVLHEPDDHDVEDDNIRLPWEKNSNYNFYSYELWMDATSDVVRGVETGVAFGTGDAYIPNNEDGRRGVIRPTSSQLVFRAMGANSNSSRPNHSMFVEEYGQLVNRFAVGPLEPETDYYFKLFVINLNFQVTESNVVKARTKAVRARFLPKGRSENRPGPTGEALSARVGPSGTSVTISLDPVAGAFTAAHELRIGGKVVVPTINSAYEIVAVIPSFTVLGLKDLVITSPTKLVDIIRQAFQVTP